MTQCWSEGELRAYLDGELPSRDIERLAKHLEECGACGGLCGELDARADRLHHWLEGLGDPQTPLCIPAIPRRVATGRRWTATAAGLAASLLLAMVWSTKRADRVVVTPQPKATVPGAPGAPPATVRPAIIRKETRPPEIPKLKPQIQYYVALDNEPIETGLVVRVGLNGGEVPADVIVGPDGRARAIRLVSEISGGRK